MSLHVLKREESIGTNVRFKDQSFLKNSFPNFEQIRRKGKLCDVTLIADQQKFSAHKIILAATIPFFDAMFLSSMSEASKREITIGGLDPSVLEAFIIFAYTGEIQITPTTVQTILIGASFLQIDSVRNFCCKYIEERLSIDNLIQVRSFATSFLCSSLVCACDKIIHENFESLIDSPIFFSLTGSELAKLLESDDLQVSSEEAVFHAIIAWCEQRSDFSFRSHSVQSLTAATKPSDDESFSTESSRITTNNQSDSPVEAENSRLKFLPKLLARIRLPLLSAQFIRDVVSKHAYIRSDIRCRDLLDEARDLLLLPDSVPTRPCSFNCRPRRGQEVVGVIYAVGGLTADGDCQSIVEAYHPLLDRWEVVESMSTQRSRIAVVVLKGRLYAIGGLDGTSRLNTVEMFDPKTGVWQKVASMNYRKSALGAAVLSDRIYVCGGYDGIASLRTCEVYNPDQNRWQVIPSMTECRSAGGVVALEDGRIFAIGGHNGLPIFASVECYHRRGHKQQHNLSISTSTSTPQQPSGGVWRQVAPMLNRRCRHGVSVLRGYIFAAGGYNGSSFLRSVEMFDPNAGRTDGGGPVMGQWTEVVPMTTPRSRVSLATSAGKLFAIGGFDGERNLNTVECFQHIECHKLTDCNFEESNTESVEVRKRSRDELEEDWLEEDPRILTSLCNPFCGGGGSGGTGEATSSTSGDSFDYHHQQGHSSRLLEDSLHKTSTYQGLESSPERLIQLLTFQSPSSSSPPSSFPRPTPENPFADWQWQPALPLIAHEGGVGVGVIPIY